MGEHEPILGFLWDELNEEKVAAHGLTPIQVDQVRENYHVWRANRRERRAAWMVIGLDNGGQCIAIPVTPTEVDGYWRPVTAWPCKESEQQKLSGKR